MSAGEGFTEARKFLASLSAAQHAAVEGPPAPTLVVAGPGTGKTRVLVARAAHRIVGGADPASVVCVTFTNKAAGEMRERLAGVFPDGEGIEVVTGTFHKLGWRLVRRFADRLGLPASPRIMDSAQRRGLASELALEHSLLGRAAGAGVRTAVDATLKTLERLDHAGVSPERAIRIAEEIEPERAGAAEALRRAARLMPLLRAACLERGLVSLDDLIRLPAELIEADAVVASRVRSEWRHLLVDEVQDANAAQLRLLAVLAPPRAISASEGRAAGRAGPDILGVGDDDQAIYAFRGSDERALLRFEQTWPGCQRFVLTENYRSRPGIVTVCNGVIGRAAARFDATKVLKPAAPHEPSKHAARDSDSAADAAPPVRAITHVRHAVFQPALAAAIRAARDAAGSWFGIAVIAPSHTQLDRVHDALEIEGIPARRVRGTPPGEDQGVQDVLAWARLLVNPDDEVAGTRILSRPPWSVSAAVRSRLGREFRRAGLGLSQRDANANEGESFPPQHAAAAAPSHAGFLDFAASSLESRPSGGPYPTAAAIRAAATRFAALAAFATTARADRAIAQIIRAAEAAHAEPLDPRSRARRIAALAGLLRFARERSDRLDPPQDLATFLRYHEHLDDTEREFSHREFEPDDPRADELAPDPPSGSEVDDDDSAPNAVTLVTAHASKGLEFHTVFVIRADADTGAFASVGKRDDDQPDAADLDDLPPDPRTPEQRARDERRRLFYVACTRAQHTLVVTGATRKTQTKEGVPHFLMELLAERIPAQTIDEVLAADTSPEAALERQIDQSARQRAGEVESQRRLARLALAEAIAQAEHAPDAATFDAAADRVRAALARLFDLARTERDAALQERPALAAPAAAAPAFPGLRPPLSLSYSSISAYLACPMCWLITQRLGLEDPPSPELAYGSAMHGALQRFYRDWAAADADGHPRPGLEKLVERVRRAIINEPALPPDARTVARAVEQARLVHQHLHDDRASIEELELSVKIPYPHARHTHTLTARLDRVDSLDGLTRIVDYKTGNAKKDLLEIKPHDLQAAIYVMALRHLRRDPEAHGVFEYWLLSTGQRGRIAFADLDLDAARATINEALEGLLAGRFERAKECKADDSPCRLFDPLELPPPENPDDW